MKGFQRIMKQQLSNSIGDLKNVIDQFLLLLNNHHIKHQAEIERMKTHQQYQHLKPIFRDCHGIVSSYALEKVRQHMQSYNLSAETVMNTVLRPCTGEFKTSMGLPCAHFIQECLRAKTSLQPDHFNIH